MSLFLRQHGPVDGSATGPPVLLIPGLGGDRSTWTPVLAALAAHRRVIVAELPGFGASPALPASVEPSPVALAVALDDALSEIGVGQVHAVGVSLGGWVALELAASGRAVTVVALAPAGFWPRALEPSKGTARRLGRMASPLLPLLLRSSRLRSNLLAGALGGPGRFGRADALALIRAYVNATDFDRVDAAMRARTFDGPRRLRALAQQLPVHILWAGRDRMVIPPSDPLPNGVHVHHLPHAGHLPMFDEPEAVVDLLLRVTANAPRPIPAWDVPAQQQPAPEPHESR